MKTISLFFTTCFISSMCVGQSAKEILSNSNDLLKDLESIKYEINGFYSVTKQKNSAISFFEFSPTDTLVGAKFYFKSLDQQDKQDIIYNGKEIINTYHDKNQMVFKSDLNHFYTRNSWHMQNSIYVIRRILPTFLMDENVKYQFKNDTLIQGNDCYVVNIIDIGRGLALGDKFIKLKDSTLLREYEIAIGKADYVPRMFKQKYLPGMYWVSYFTNIEINVKVPENFWNSILSNEKPSYYKDDFELLSSSEWSQRLKNRAKSHVGTLAPEFELPSLNGDTVKVGGNTQKLILLEFMFIGCAPCIKAMPFLQDLHENYKNDNFELMAIETQNSLEIISKFINQKKLNFDYQVLHNGKEVSIKYGVPGAPTFILIDRNGKIILSESGFNTEIAELIKRSIEDNI